MIRKYLQQIRLIFGMIALAMSLAIVSPASAILTLRISDGVNPTIDVTDGGAGDASGLTGQITYTNSYGNLLVNLESGLSKPILGSVIAPHLDLTSVFVASGPVTLTLRLSDTDFSGAGLAPFLASIGGTLNAPNSTITYSVYRDLSNTLFGTGAGTLICTTGPLSGNLAFSSNCGANVSIDDSFSVTLEAVVHQLDAGITSFDAVVRDAPEPSAMILLALGLIGFAVFNRRNAFMK